MSLSDPRSFKPTGLLEDIYQKNQLRVSEIANLQGYDRSTKWILIGSAGAPAFQNGWLNYDAIQAQAAFKRSADGTVFVKGLVKSGTIGTTVFTLPEGFRPLEPRLFSNNTWDGTNYIIGRVDVAISGGVVAVVGGNPHFSLDSIVFPAEA